MHMIRPKKIFAYVALSQPTVKCEKTGSGFLFFCFCFVVENVRFGRRICQNLYSMA